MTHQVLLTIFSNSNLESSAFSSFPWPVTYSKILFLASVTVMANQSVSLLSNLILLPRVVIEISYLFHFQLKTLPSFSHMHGLTSGYLHDLDPANLCIDLSFLLYTLEALAMFHVTFILCASIHIVPSTLNSTLPSIYSSLITVLILPESAQPSSPPRLLR